MQEIGTVLAPNTWPCGTILAVCLLTFSGTQASAADEVIDLKPGFATVVTVERPVGTAIVGNPEVADISVRAGDKKVVVTAKKAIGATNLIILDVDDKEMFNAEINVAGNLSGSTRGAVHVQPTVNRHALHNFQAYYCPPGGGLCQRVNDPNANLSQLQMVGPPQPQTSIPNINLPPSVTAPLGAPPESAPGLSQ